MKYFSGFFMGILVGVGIGLLFAPSSGEELRAQIQQEAEIELKKLEAEWQRRLQQVQKSIEETRNEVKSMAQKDKAGDGTEAAEG
jgi:gas vesicle protein